MACFLGKLNRQGDIFKCCQRWDKIEKLENEFALVRDSLTTVRSEKEELARAYTSKVAEYKKQLRYTQGRINDLTNDSDELEEQMQRLEREKFKLNEENDRYRRQLGGRFGSDNKVENQLEIVQKEFKNALDEIKELKRKLNEQESVAASLPPIDEGDEATDTSYSRDAVSQSTLVQLRAEYEATLETLNDEKRELIMKNSAAITDVQKAEKRAWESDNANTELKRELTSLKLQNERLQHELSSANEIVPFNEKSSTALVPMNYRSSPGVEAGAMVPYEGTPNDENAIPSVPKSSETAMVVHSPGAANRKMRALSPSTARFNEQSTGLQAALSPSHIQSPQACPFGGRSPGKDGPSDCKQS